MFALCVCVCVVEIRWVRVIVTAQFSVKVQVLFVRSAFLLLLNVFEFSLFFFP
jgi:hypothetical protein